MYWALRSTVREGHGTAPWDIWRELRPEVVRDVTGSDADRLALAVQLFGSVDSFVRLSELPKVEYRIVVSRMRDLAASSLVLAEAPRATLERVRLRRALRLVLACALVAAFATAIFAWAMRRPNLAASAARRTSSTWAQCFPELGECGGSNLKVFFHTNEEAEPWIEFDFGSAMRFSSLIVRNRRDCCKERATPLVAELSDDGQTYREFARIDSVFTEWKPAFAPQVARFLRLRVARTSTLHLEGVDVYP
jgi:hypothetical protein